MPGSVGARARAASCSVAIATSSPGPALAASRVAISQRDRPGREQNAGRLPVQCPAGGGGHAVEHGLADDVMAEAEVLTGVGQDLCPYELLDRLQQGRGCGTEHGGEIVETKHPPEDGRGDGGAS